MYSKTYIPYKGYFSSPFARWQGTLQNEHSVELGAATARRWFGKRGFDPKMFDYLFLGVSVAHHRMFYAAPWAAAMMGADHIAACHIPQACSTGTTCMNQAAVGIEADIYSTALYLGADRTSNGPHTVWPNPGGMGGQVISENWMLDNINVDPWGGVPMIQTAEKVVKHRREESAGSTATRWRSGVMSSTWMAWPTTGLFRKAICFPSSIGSPGRKSASSNRTKGSRTALKSCWQA